MALQNVEANITLDLYNHDTTPATVKAIQLDSETRYVAARLQNVGVQYDVDSEATVQLIVVRPDKVGVQITGTTFTYGDESSEYLGPYAELTQVALAVSGKMRGQFKITSGTQILRTEIFAISNGEALDASTDEWADEYDGYNLEEMATSIETNTADIATLEADVEQIKEDLSDMNTATSADVGKALKAKTVTDGKVTEWEFGDAGSTVELDDTLTSPTKAAQAKAVGDELFVDTSVETLVAPDATSANYKLIGDGNCASNNSYSIYKYAVTAGDTYKVVSNDYFQFQNAPGVPTGNNRNVVGEIYGVGTFNVTVPETATFLITSALKTDTESGVFSVTVGEKISKIEALANRLDAIDTATATDVGKTLKVKTVTDGHVSEWEFDEAGGGSVETDTTLAQSGVPADAKATGDAINEVKNAWGTITDTLVPSVTSGEYYKISDGTVGTYMACNRTDLIDISGWASANVTCYGLTTNFAGVCYYDKDQTYISGEYDNGRYTDAPLHIPANAKYVGVSSHNSFTISITYTRYITPSETANVIDNLKAKVIDGYMDKNIVLFGDSITTELHKYVPALKQIMSFKSLTNYARGFCRWSFFEDTVYDITSTGNAGTSDNVIWNQYNRLVADVANESVEIPDAIIIMAGTNDAIYRSDVGTVADVMAITNIRSEAVGTLNNVCASIRRVIEDISATFPYTKIVICTPIQSGNSGYQTRLDNIVPCIREICGYYSIDVPDMFKDVGISYYIEKDADVYLSTGDGGIHPTEAGGKLMANFMKAWLTAHYGYDETITKTYVPQS